MTARAWIMAVGVVAAVAASGAAWAAADDAAGAAAGQKLAFDRAMGNCLACHTMKGGDVASNVGPELVGIKAKFPNRKDLYAIIYDEESRNPQTVMPAFGKNLILSPQQINQVIDFLYTR